MESDKETLEAVENRHKKEKKEVQAKIQALKKAAKNDKTKKKDLIAEVARIEHELEERHRHEIESAQLENTENVEEKKNEGEDATELEQSKIKISKAQKRRDKKTQLAKERDAQIKLQEQENLHGPRNLEIQAISTKLKEKHLKIFPISSDGDCLYKAVAHQLQLKRNQQLPVEELRQNVANYIRQNKHEFIPFMSNPNTYEMLTESEFEDYCDKIIHTKVWGGQLEIRALSNSLKCPINVIQALGPGCIEQGTEFDDPPLIITYHRHMYRLGEHYNSTCAIETESA